ncbi:MAG TPA: hypothetical protein VMS38_09060 [Pseudorhodoferax sp.]|nr:hypothetical protein [Pseudorhodoferax sp.]
MDTESLLQTTALAAGQNLHLAVEAGTVLVAVQGGLRVDEAPRWLAERLLPVGARVGEGQAYAVEQTGWICVTALADARLAQVQPPGLAARLVGRLLGRRSHSGPAVC